MTAALDPGGGQHNADGAPVSEFIKATVWGCAAFITVAGAAAIVWKGLQGMWRRARKAEDLLDQLKTNSVQIGELVAEVRGLAVRLDEHLALPHGDPGGQPAAWVSPKPNGPRPGRRT